MVAGKIDGTDFNGVGDEVVGEHMYARRPRMRGSEQASEADMMTAGGGQPHNGSPL